MAYSDYGGYAYRNGKRLPERSDVIYPSKDLLSTPGAWPGWWHEEGRLGNSHHVLLGSGPLFVSLRKQTTITVYRGPTEVPLQDIAVERREDDTFEHGGKTYFNSGPWEGDAKPAVFEVDGYRLEVHWLEEDNSYQYVRLVEPDGAVWHGFSGYGVGAGLEGEYGFSTPARVRTLFDLFPFEEEAVDDEA